MPQRASIAGCGSRPCGRLWPAGECAPCGADGSHFPSNAQLDVFLGWLAANAPPPGVPLSLGSDGTRVLECLRALADTLRLVLRDKNSDELLQDTLRLLWPESQELEEYEWDDPDDEDLAAAVAGSARGWGHPDGELAGAGLHLRRLATIFATSPEVREALTGLVGVARDMLPSELRPPLPGPSSSPDAPPPEPYHVPGSWGGRSWGGSQSGSEFDEFEDARSEVSLDEASSAFLALVQRAVASLQEQPGYAASMAWLLALLEAYDAELVGVVQGTPAPTPTRRILRNVALFSDRFASGPATPLQSALVGLYADAGRSLGLRLLWRDIDAYIRAVLLETGYVETGACIDRGRELHARAAQWLDDALYRVHWAELVRGVSGFLGWSAPEAAAPDTEDTLTARLKQSCWDLFAGIALDARGHCAWKPRLWTDLAGMLAPHLRSLGVLCIPRVEFVSPNMEVVLENVALDWDDVLPSVLSWEMYDAVRYSVYGPDEFTKTRVRLGIQEVHADVRGGLGCIWLKGLGLRDTGLVDILLARGGVSATVDLDIDLRPGAAHVLRPLHVAVKIDGLSMRVRVSALGIDWLYRVLLPLAAVPWLRRTLEEKWTELLQEALLRVDAELVLLRDRLAQDASPGRVLQVVAERWREIQAEPPPVKPAIFKMSARLEDAVVDTTRSARESWVYRRWRTEQAARAQVRADARVQLLPCAAVGLFASERKPWASPVFS